ncbi:MAG: MFS transporter [Parcubacteria group bacterium]|nr:MFS transporter [Parcubacteria group bacterium]
MRYFDGNIEKGFTALLSMRAIQTLAGGLLGVFLPIFLYNLFEENIRPVIYFFLASSFVYVVLLGIGAQFLNTFGFRRALALSILFGVSFYGLFSFVTEENVLYIIPILLLLLTLDRLLYWIPYHVDFAKFTDKENRGREVSLLFASIEFLGALGPVVAGYLLDILNFKVLFIVATVLYSFMLIPIFKIPKTNESFSWSYGKTWKEFFSKERRAALIALGAIGAENTVAVVIWPIFIFEILHGNYLQIGALSTIVVGLTIALQLGTGKYIDFGSMAKQKTLRIGSLFYAVGWIIKIFVATAFQIFIVGFYHGLTKIFTMTPFDTLIYEIAADSGHYVDEFTVLREMAIHTGRVLTLILILGFLFFFNLESTFIIAATASLLLNAVYFIRKPELRGNIMHKHV